MYIFVIYRATCMHACMHVCVRACVRACVVRACVWISACVRACAYVCGRSCVPARVLACVRAISELPCLTPRTLHAEAYRVGNWVLWWRTPLDSHEILHKRCFMLVHRLRRWPNNKTTSCGRLWFNGQTSLGSHNTSSLSPTITGQICGLLVNTPGSVCLNGGVGVGVWLAGAGWD